LYKQVDIYYSTRSPWNDLCAVGYTFGAGMFELEKLKGGSPYGSGTYAGDGSRQPSEPNIYFMFSTHISMFNCLCFFSLLY